MSKRKQEDSPSYGFRVLRNKKEFSPHGRSVQVVLEEIDTASVFNKGLQRQLQALEANESNELVPIPASLSTSRSRPPRPVSVMPLSNLLSTSYQFAPLLKKPRVATPLPAELTGKARRKAQSRANYRGKRDDNRSAEQVAADSALKRHVRKRLAAADTTVLAETALVPRHGSRAGGQRKAAVKVYSNTEVLSLSGLRLIEWDGTVSRVLRTPSHHRLMVLHAKPKNWEPNMAAADARLEQMFQDLCLVLAQLVHRRGAYLSVGTGYAYGGGQTEPGSYVNTPHNTKVIEEALADPAIQNIARYVDQGLLQHFPKLHALYTNLDDKIVNVDNPAIKRAFENCCFSALHFNLHSASTVDHYDLMNILTGICATYVSGDFDYKRSGHLIAHELGVVVEFPPGSSIFLPSCPVKHRNIPVAAHERRSSMAFFVPAGLLRWYHNGFMSDKELKERASPKQLKAWKESRDNLWNIGLDWLHYPPAM